MNERHVLFPHQRQALTRIQDESRVALFMEMRLGKTPVIIRWAKRHLPARGRVLVVAPMSTLADWDEELRREGYRPRDITHLEGLDQKKREENLAGWGWYLINYEGVRVSPIVAEARWDILICDESTYLRNPKAQITKVMTREYSHVPYRAVMSGDPAPEGEENYFSQFQFLHGSFMSFGNFWAWRNAKFKQNPFQSWDWQPRPGVRDEIKTWVHRHAVVMTRQQYGIGGRKIYERRVVEQTPEQRAAIKQLVSKFQYDYIETNFATVRDVWLARVAGGFSPDRENPGILSQAKTTEILNLMKGELKKEPVIIWFHFNEELTHVWNALLKAGIRASGIHGAMDVERRKDVRQRFQNGEYQVLCVQIKIGRVGWNLSRASTAIYYSNSYAFEDRTQSEDRIVHPTKKQDLLYIDLITRGSLDDAVVQALRDKRLKSRAFMRQLNTAALAQLRRWYGLENQTEGRRATTTNESESTATRARTRRIFPGR